MAGSQKSGGHKDSRLRQVSKSIASAKRRTPSGTPKLDFSDKRGLSPGHTNLSASTSVDSTVEDNAQGDIQARILKELKRMNNRLDQVEDQVAAARGSGTNDNQKLSTVKKVKKDNVSRKKM